MQGITTFCSCTAWQNATFNEEAILAQVVEETTPAVHIFRLHFAVIPLKSLAEA
jgi:hypothetical protein